MGGSQAGSRAGSQAVTPNGSRRVSLTESVPPSILEEEDSGTASWRYSRGLDGGFGSAGRTEGIEENIGLKDEDMGTSSWRYSNAGEIDEDLCESQQESDDHQPPNSPIKKGSAII